MKVLHVWDQAGVANNIAKFMDRIFKTQSKIIVRTKFDPLLLDPTATHVGGPAWWYGVRVLLKALSVDIVQVHSWDTIVPPLKRVGAKVVLTYHGRVRNTPESWAEHERYWSRADALTTFSAHMLGSPGTAPAQVRVINNPVDTDVFYDYGKHEPGTAFHLDYGATKQAKEAADRLGLKLTVMAIKDRIPYVQMPALLNKFEYYIDIKNWKDGSGQMQAGGSKTGLEALACGLKVVNWDGSISQGLPDENRPENVVSKYYRLYEEVLAKA